MHRHYIGIITQRGLEALVPESDESVRCLHEWLGSRSRPGICYWFDMDDQAASELDQHVRRGDTCAAWHALQAHVRFCGPLLQTSSQPSTSSAELDSARLN